MRTSTNHELEIHCDCATPQSAPRPLRSAFTLVELLVTIVIISILAALFLGGLRAAQQAAATASTQALIAKLNNQLQLRYESYRTRRLPVNPTLAYSSREAAAWRLQTIRELMRMELPDRWTDVNDASMQLQSVNGPFPAPLIQPTAVNRAYRRRYAAAATPPTQQYEDAECLYLIITTGLSDNTMGTDHINARDVGDADGDGFPEFHDGWGRPIHFLRWAPGFVSEMQVNDPANRHDPFDPLKLQVNAFALFPLVYSAGPDGKDDIYHGQTPFSCSSQIFPVTLVSDATSSPWKFSSVNFNYNPYVLPSGWPVLLGAPNDNDGDGETSDADNIHNHLIGLP